MSHISERDLRIKTDLMTALLSFAESHDQQTYFNGYALYCMQIASSFIKKVKEDTGNVPDGLATDQLRGLNNLAKQSDDTIKVFRNKTTCHSDFDKFYNLVKGLNDNQIMREELRVKNEELTKLKQEHQELQRKHDALVKDVQVPINELKQVTQQMSQDFNRQHGVQDELHNVMRKNQMYLATIYESCHEFMKKLQASHEPMSEQLKQFQDSVQKKIVFFEAIGGVNYTLESLQQYIQTLTKGNETLQHQLDEATARAAGGPSLSLSQKSMEILTLYSKFKDLDSILPKRLNPEDLQHIQTDFSTMDIDLGNHMHDIFTFARSAYMYFYHLKTLKDKDINFFSRSNAFNSMKKDINLDKLNQYLETTCNSSIKTIKDLKKLSDKYDFFKHEIVLGLSETTRDIKISNYSGDGAREQWKESFLSSEMTLHCLQHHLLFWFTSHLIRLVNILSQDDVEYRIKRSVKQDLNVILNIFYSIFPESDKHDIIFSKPNNQVVIKYLELPEDQRENYPTTLLHQGLYANCSSESFPCLTDDVQNLKVRLVSLDNSDVLSETIALTGNKTFSQIFEQLAST